MVRHKIGIIIVVEILILVMGVLFYNVIYQPDNNKELVKVIPEKNHYDALVSGDAFDIDVDVGRDVPISYESEDPSVAEVSEDGEVIPKGVGETNIIVKTPKTMLLQASETKIPVKIANKQELTSKEMLYTFSYGDKAKRIEISSNAKGVDFDYESSDPDILTVDSKGVVTIKKVGTAKVTVKSPETKEYCKAEITVPVTIEKKKIEIKPKETEMKIPVIKLDQTIELETNYDGKLDYEVKDPAVLEVNEDGLITPKEYGTTEVKISHKEDDTTTAAEATVTIEIEKTTATMRAEAAVEWAREIANDDSFAYGAGQRAHRSGCYFCGTNLRKKGSSLVDGHSYEKTYCCNPFCFSAYAHGGQVPSMLVACQDGHNGAWGNDWIKYGFENIGKPDYSELLPGDVFTSSNHMWMVSDPENDLCVEASGGGWGPNSISEHTGAQRKYAKAKFVLRYVGE